jgi:hypothetical protein
MFLPAAVVCAMIGYVKEVAQRRSGLGVKNRYLIAYRLQN